jgi:IS66 Orf2 like protein
LDSGSRVNREVPARFCERPGVRFPRPTHHRTGWCLFAKRLEHGRFRFPHAEAKQELSVQVFQLVLDGIALGPRHCE